MTGQPEPPPRHAAWLEIDLGAILHNVSLIRGLIGPAELAAVVKADAYGHGSRRVAEALAPVVDALCVATLDEAIALRAQAEARVLLLYPVPASGAEDAVAAGVELTVMSAADLRHLQVAARRARSPVALQLCVETGFGRGGLFPDDLAAVATSVLADPRFRLAGLWSHLASPEDGAASARQLERFDSAAGLLAASGIPAIPRHMASSGGIFAEAAPALQMVRPGLAIYGVLDEALPIAEGAQVAAVALRPAMSLKARPVAISDIPAGGSVGYGGRWQAQRPSRVAILPVGYGDGYLRGAQPGAWALARGTRVPLVGAVSMDAVAVDITDLPGAENVDEYVLLGRQDGEAISAGELARQRNTIAWEVLSGMAARLARVYYR
jgi:alanine racemase